MKKIFLLLAAWSLICPCLQASVEFIAPDVYVVSPDGNVVEDLFTHPQPSWNEVYSIKKGELL